MGLQRVRHDLVTEQQYVCVYVYVCARARTHLAAQLCPTLCNHMDSSLQGSSVYEIFQARILE